MRQIFHTFVILCLCTLAAAAQESATKTQTIALKAAHLVDVQAGRILNDQTVLIVGDRIEQVGPSNEMELPSEAHVIDLGNATLLPGLIDCHVHLTADPRYAGLRGLTLSIPRQTLIGARNARLTLEAGFTTVRNVGAEGYSDVALPGSIEAGGIPGPPMPVSGSLPRMTRGHCGVKLPAAELHQPARLAAARLARAFATDSLVATEPEQHDGEFAGGVAGVPSCREGKIPRLEQWMAERGWNWDSFEDSVFYSDSLNDLPLLCKVKQPVAVKPDATLRAHAEQNGWPILEW